MAILIAQRATEHHRCWPHYRRQRLYFICQVCKVRLTTAMRYIRSLWFSCAVTARLIHWTSVGAMLASSVRSRAGAKPTQDGFIVFALPHGATKDCLVYTLLSAIVTCDAEIERNRRAKDVCKWWKIPARSIYWPFQRWDLLQRFWRLKSYLYLAVEPILNIHVGIQMKQNKLTTGNHVYDDFKFRKTIFGIHGMKTKIFRRCKGKTSTR